MHLKNFSLIRRNEKVELAPAYDFLNTTIALKAAKEELALPIRGKKSRITRNDLITYFARERLELNERILDDVLSKVSRAAPAWHELLDRSFLSANAKEKFRTILSERGNRMQL